MRSFYYLLRLCEQQKVSCSVVIQSQLNAASTLTFDICLTKNFKGENKKLVFSRSSQVKSFVFVLRPSHLTEFRPTDEKSNLARVTAHNNVEKHADRSQMQTHHQHSKTRPFSQTWWQTLQISVCALTLYPPSLCVTDHERRDAESWGLFVRGSMTHHVVPSNQPHSHYNCCKLPISWN